MDQKPISDDIKHFILINIPSIPFLEAMMLLRGDIEHHWEIAQVAKRLFINDKTTAGILTQLYEAGIITIVNQEPLQYKYQPQTDNLKTIINRLAEIYSTNLIEVTNLIHSNINKKAQKFANAFLLRKDP